MSDVRVVYTAMAGLTPPRHDMVIRFDVAGHHGRLFRVTNHPKADKAGTFTVELEALEPAANDEPADTVSRTSPGGCDRTYCLTSERQDVRLSNMTNIETATDIYVSGRETGTHTVTFWHAEITVYWPAPDGGSYYQEYLCTHNHDSSDKAQKCEKRLVRLAQERQGDVSALRWVVKR